MSTKFAARGDWKSKKFAASQPSVPEWRHSVKWKPNITKLFDEFPPSDSYENLSEPSYFHTEDAPRILFVLDWVPGEDLQAHRLLSGVTGDLFINIMKAAKSLYLKGQNYPTSSWRVTSFSAYRTQGRAESAQLYLNNQFAKRLRRTILEYKPTTVVCLGHRAAKVLIGDSHFSLTNKRAPWLGVPVRCEVENKREQHKFQVISSLSLTDIISGGTGPSYLLGYVARHFANALTHSHRHAIDNKVARAHQSVMIDTMPKFMKMMEMLKRQPFVSIDTETKNLNKVTNTLLTAQFAKCEKYGYFVPIYHKDTPFTGKELKKIKREMRGYFEGDNDNQYHIYAHAKFDLLMFRSALDMIYMKNDVWDIFGAEFALDENMTGLTAMSDGGYYSLLNTSVQYGSNIYLDADFGKSDRSNIAHEPLSKRLVRYGTTDVIVPLMVHHKQKDRAKEIKYHKFQQVVTRQISDTIHGLTKMEATGSGVDLEYLFFLNTPKSPINTELKSMEDKILSSEAVQKVEALLADKSGESSSKGLFGGSAIKTSRFNLGTKEHQAMLFFDVLKLEPLSFGKNLDKNGERIGKIDKKFQAAYAEVPEIQQFTALSKAKKLRNSYVHSFLNKLRESDDFRWDHRIRPTYGYLKVVTYRTNATDPNLQQIPSRSALGKHIKRLFVARRGALYIKVDYRVHEVRCWGIISNDRNIASLFKTAQDLWDLFRKTPTKDMIDRLDYEADIHIVNVQYFFQKTLKELKENLKMKKELRDGVKGVTFGIIYQMSVKSLAETIKQTVEYTQSLYDGFVKRFTTAINWNETQKQNARKNYFVEAPIGIRRNLFGHILPAFKSESSRNYVNTMSIHADMDRRAVNSPPQGFGAQCMSIGNRQLDHMTQYYKLEHGRVVGLYTNNSVHDSLENEGDYKDLILGLDMVERCLTSEVKRELKERYGLEINSDLQIDFEIGAALSDLHKWDFSFPSLVVAVYESLKFQRDELKHEIDVKATMDTVFLVKDYPKWLRKQIKSLTSKNWEHYTEDEQKLIRKYHKKVMAHLFDE